MGVAGKGLSMPQGTSWDRDSAIESDGTSFVDGRIAPQAGRSKLLEALPIPDISAMGEFGGPEVVERPEDLPLHACRLSDSGADMVRIFNQLAVLIKVCKINVIL